MNQTTQTTSDALFSNDVDVLRHEIIRLRTFLDCEFQARDTIRIRCEHLELIIDKLISNNYGKPL